MTHPTPRDLQASRKAAGPGRPRLPVDRIIGTALLIVDEEGAEALTLRSLATRLGSSTATLYRHFPGRVELVRAVVDSLFAEVQLRDDRLTGATWDDSILEVARCMFEVLDRHRNATPLLLAELPAGSNALKLRERCLALLEANGFGPYEAVQTYATVARYVLGFGVQAAAESAGPTEDTSALTVGSVGLADEFEYGLGLMVDGLRARQSARSEDQ